LYKSSLLNKSKIVIFMTKFSCPFCERKLRNDVELRKHKLQHESITEQLSSEDFDYVLLKVPRLFLREVRRHLKQTGQPEYFNGFVLESLRQRITKESS
jgi:hypothetical protein